MTTHGARPARRTTGDDVGRGWWIFFVAMAAVVAIVALAGAFLWPARSDDLLVLARHLRTQADAPLAPVYALAVFVAGVTVGFPSSLLTAASMLLFGIAMGGAIAFTGVLVGGSIVYAVGRFAARGLVDRWLARRRDAWLDRLSAALARRGFVTVVLLRLTPIPYAVANLALGATRIGFPAFFCGTALGILPSLAIVAALTDGLDVWLLTPGRHPARLAAAAMAVVVAAAAALSIGHLARRRARREGTPAPQDQ